MLRIEILIVLAVTFGTSGVRAALRLVDSLLSPQALNEQSVTLNDAHSTLSWLDLALQATSALTLIAWGALALYLLGQSLPRPHLGDWWHGAILAAVIGIPGLVLYIAALHFGWTKEIVVTTEAARLPTLVLWSAANAFAEEIVVVMWLCTRLRQLGYSPAKFIAASAVLRGTYHLYQGVSAGFGNIVMGVVYATYFHKTGKVWPLVLGHFLIDATAYLGYHFLDVSWLKL